jgi:hypothetical protein
MGSDQKAAFLQAGWGHVKYNKLCGQRRLLDGRDSEIDLRIKKKRHNAAKPFVRA